MFLVFDKTKNICISYSICNSNITIFYGRNNKNRRHSREHQQNKKNYYIIYNVETKEKKVALTMNCAWNADDIDKILNVLKENNVKITFFIVGDWIDKYPEAVKKIKEAGHEIGSHSNTHPHVNNLSYEENIKEIEESCKKIEQITGTKSTLYRAPYGEYNSTVIKSAQDKKLYPIQWNLDTLDYTGLNRRRNVE